MLNIDTSFNRERLIGLFLKTNNLLSDISIIDFDKHFYFEEPIIVTGQSFNTKLPVIAKLSSKYFGRKMIKYNRLSLLDLPIITVKQDGESSLYELLPKINTQYGLLLTKADIYNENLLDGFVGDVTFNLEFKPSSLIFLTDGTVPWVMDTGNWDDFGVWDDNKIWRDTPILGVLNSEFRWTDTELRNDNGIWIEGT